MKHFKLGLVLIALVVMGNALQGAIPSAQRQALIDLYTATNGDNWTLKTGWKAGTLYSDGFALPGTEGTWKGVTVTADVVTNINLSANNLVGTLPTSIGNLTGLISLNLHTNTLSGTLPTELGNLTNLTLLHLYENAFTGSLPSSLGNLIHVTQFDAYNNQLSGTIPSSLGSMAALQQLNLYNNAFTGSLPTQLGNLSALQLLDTHANQLSGGLPASFGNLTNLTSLLLSGNLLTGSIPTEWGGMSALQLLYLSNNLLSGTVPTSLGGLTHLIGLKLDQNGLTGSIPSALGSLTTLTTLDLSRNHFDGTIPSSLGNLTALVNLALYSNKLAGPVPTALTALTNLNASATDIAYNALYTSDGTLLAFLNGKDADWAATQTVAPTSVTAASLDNAVIMVSWLPITYTNHTGGYEVYVSDTTGGPYTLFGQTADKTVSSLNVTGLTPGHRYYFVVRTVTNAHVANTNIVESADSSEATSVAWTLVNVHVTGTVLSGTSPLAGVVMSGLPGSPVTNASGVYDGTVPADWSGTVTPTLAGLTFTPASRNYTSLTTNQSGQDYASAFASYPDRQALTDLYNATAGDSWTSNAGWKTAPLYADGFALPGTEGTWFGLTVDGGTHRVTHIALMGNNLTGALPASLGALTSLQSLNLNSNHLSGTIPATLGNLTSLQSLQMVTNQLSGSIPVELGNLTNLQDLYLSENQLSGTIPSGLGALTGLQDINIYSNNLTGSIPAQLGNLTNLVSLYLNRNQLTGSIPTQLGSLANLQVLSLYNNQLSGTIPTQLGNMTALRTLHLQGNQLTGSIPATLGSLAQLQVLALQANQLSGALPSSLGNLTNLQQLTINSNMLVGAIPTSLASLVNLSTTDIGFNGLHTSDATLIAFLNAKDSNWYETQTIPPSGMTATALNGAHVLVSWVPISYTSNTGGYKVLSSQTSGGPYSLVGQTTDKTATSLEVSGLTPGETYYFIVQTHTDAHEANANAIDSDNSAQVSAVAWMQVTVRVTGTVTLGSSPLAGVVMSGLTGNPATDATGVYDVTLPAGWSGTVTPTLSGYSFTPAPRTYTGLTTDQTGQDYAASYVPIPDRQVLIELYNATNGNNWTDNSGWKTPPLYADGFALPGTEGSWYGVHKNGVVTNINLHENNLVGTLPASLGSLTGLTSLNLHTNQLSGTIPASLGNLTNLTVLHLYQNAFTGTLPSTLGNLIHLTQLNVHYNQLSGEIPASLGTMSSLQELRLYNNAFTGALPTELGNLTTLHILDAHVNQLSGGLPVSLGNLTNLTDLLLNGNLLTGSIPTELGGMSALQYLYLGNNQLSGTVPTSLGGLTHLIGLKLDENGLTDSIPSALGSLTTLTTLDLSRNHFDGTIPSSLGNLTALVNLALYSNKLAGPVPTSLENLTNLSTTETAIGYNALYTSDGTLLSFLTAKDEDWAATQTIAPTGVTATSLDNATIMVSWIPIPYTGHTGAYELQMSETSGGPYTPAGETVDKTVASLNVTGLTPGHRYYFVVRTRTNAHVANTNIVESANSAEATAVAWTLVNVHVTGTVLSGTSPLAGVVMSGLPGSPATNASGVYDGSVPAEWSGTVTPTLAGVTFAPASRTYTSITTNQTGQDYASAFASYPDRQALTDLYNATGGDSWTIRTGWKTAPLYADGFGMPGTEGTWFGVTVDGGTHRVTHIDLNTNNLVGTIPATLSSLSGLLSLNLSQNQLSGSIPASLGTLPSLQVLSLNGNALTGSIPTSLGGLTALQQLWLSSNQLTGTIPAALGSLTNLSQLWLNHNLLTGTIPTALGGLTGIHYMSLSDNQLTGSIPSELGSLTGALYLYLQSNQLSGAIPSALGSMTSLTQLLLNNNQLTGSIPTALGGLTQLHVLALQINQLSGALPSSLGNLTNLQQLSINSNMLVGPVPTSLANLVNLAEGQTDIGFNGLYTSDAALIAFLGAKDPNWYETQTIAPSGMTAAALNGANILVSWIPISYTSNAGYYKVSSSQTPGGPYTYVGQTTDKTATSLQVSGLTPGETYYFVVQTHTDAHPANANAIDSNNSSEVSATAWTQVSIRVTGTVTLGSAPLAGVVMSGLTGNPATDVTGVYDVTVPAGWGGTVTPTLSGYSFTPASRTYTGLTTDQTGQDYAAAYAAIPARQVLIDLYNATNGNSWTNNAGWKTPPLYSDGFALPGTEGTWHGITVDGGTVTVINESSNNLVGTLPASLGSLSGLHSLNLHTNQLSGTIPDSLGNLTNLIVMHLYENSLTGTLPATLGNLTHLQQLNVHYNQLSGEIPASLGTMSSLLQLNLYNNAFTGALPTELGNLTTLQILDAHANQFSGALPVSLGNLTNLTDLLLNGNLLTGSIPTQWGGMSALQYLYLNNNQLSGTAPASLGGLTHLIGLKLNENGLTGSIPSALGSLASLTTLDLSRNHFDGTIPTELGNLSALTKLYLFANKLAGPVPTSLANLTNLDTSETAIGYNALFTTDGPLLTFLNSKDYDWTWTQTVAPSSVTATSLDNVTILVSWLPIDFVDYTGAYKLYISDASGGPYSLIGQTGDKTVTSLQVTSLTPGQRYYFVVRTQSNANTANTNIIESANSAEVSAVAWMQVVHVTGTITAGGSPLPNVVMSGFTVPPVTNALGIYTGTQSAGWSGTVTPVLSGYTFAPASRTYTTIATDLTGQDYAATPVTTTYTLTITSVNGTVAKVPDLTAYNSGATVQLTATPATGYHFVNWTGDATGSTNPTNITMDGNKSVTANFAINTYTLTYTAGAGGTISGTTPQTVNYNGSGTQVTAVPSAGFHFVNWSDGGLTAARTDANVTANLSATANFAINTYTLTYIAGAGGTISGTSPQTVDYNGSGTTVTAVPDASHHFVDWSDGVLTAARTDANVMANLSVTANFAVNVGSITVTSPNGGESWARGSNHAVTWTQTGLTGTVTIDLYKGGVYQKTLGTPDATAETYSWTIATNETIGTDFRVLVWQGSVSDESNANFEIAVAAIRKDDLLGTWDGQGVYYLDSDNGGWYLMASPATMITSGDLDGDGIDDLIGIWPSQGGVWAKYSSTGNWAYIASTAQYISTGDMNGDGRVDLLGNWIGQGVYYRDSMTGSWVLMASEASMIASGDLDGDGTDDLIGIWPSQGGVWVKYSSTGNWAYIGSTAQYISSGDMNGDGREDLLGNWIGQGVYYRDSITGSWVLMASEATMIASGDLDGDGIDDLLGIWPSQGGVWVKYSTTGGWRLLSSTAQYIATGKMRPGASPEAIGALALPMGGSAQGPEAAVKRTDESSTGPGGWRFVYLTEKNLVPQEKPSARLTRIPGPGEPMFSPQTQANIIPGDPEKRKIVDRRKEKIQK